MMTIKSLRNLQPVTDEQRRENAEKTRKSLESYKRAAKDIQEICASNGWVEPVIVAEK
ncbi:hypothetical protein [Pseudomonas sp. LRF_L74]|uniref:hypothetical protein n=1 Tax=Pseudomonas sp. LRF_L74 TaxID=3369422 RepID=UPI003F5D6E2E